RKRHDFFESFKVSFQGVVQADFQCHRNFWNHAGRLVHLDTDGFEQNVVQQRSFVSVALWPSPGIAGLTLLEPRFVVSTLLMRHRGSPALTRYLRYSHSAARPFPRRSARSTPSAPPC